jgi:hypothetical protein
MTRAEHRLSDLRELTCYSEQEPPACDVPELEHCWFG